MAITTIVNNQANLEFNDNGTVFYLNKTAIGTINTQAEFVYIQNRDSGDIILDWNLVTSPVTASPAELADTLGGYLVQSASGTGWATYSDSEYTDSNKFIIPNGSNLAIPNNANTTIDAYLPEGVFELYDSATQKINSLLVGNAFLLRLDFSAETNNNNGIAEVTVDIGGSVGVILSRLLQFPRGANTPRKFSTSSALYSLDTFVANGAELRIESITGITEIWDISYTIIQTHSAVS